MLLDKSYSVIAVRKGASSPILVEHHNLVTIIAELRDQQAVDHIIKSITESYSPPLKALINNAAFQQIGAIEDLSVDLIKDQFNVNLFAAHQLTVGLLPIFRRQRHGTIVQVSSFQGLYPLPYQGAYAASKAALDSITKSMQIELHGTGVQLYTLHLGPVQSELRKKASNNFTNTIDVANSKHSLNYETLLDQPTTIKMHRF